VRRFAGEEEFFRGVVDWTPMKLVEHKIDLFYPRNDDPSRDESRPTSVRVGLSDVRAADDLIIDYDFERDGYRIRMATVHEWEPEDQIMDPKLVEVAFAPSWIGDAAEGGPATNCNAEDTALVETLCEHSTEEDIRALADMIGEKSPELSAFITARHRAVVARRTA
jgi:hypothetical protein